MKSRSTAFVAGWGVLQLGVLLVVMLVAFRLEWPPPAGGLPFERAEFLAADDASTPVTLPDDWRQRGYTGRQAQYRIELELPQVPPVTWAVMLPSVRMATELRLNGHSLGDSQLLEPPVARMWQRPLLYVLPTGLLIPGRNTIEIHLAASSPGQGFLGRPLAGPLSVLEQHTARRFFVQQTLVQLILGTTVAVSLLMLMLWSLRRHESVYGYYGVGMLVWAAHNLNFVIQQPPVPIRVWEAWSFLSLGGFTIIALFFIHRYLGYHRPRLERALALFGVAGIGFFALLPEPAARLFGERIWNLMLMATGLYLATCCHLEGWRRQSHSVQVLAAASTPIVVFGLHDVLINSGRLPWGSGHLLHYAAAGVLLAFTSLLVVRLGRSLTVVERMNAEMNDRVAAARREIEDSTRQLKELERSRWLGAERERIARDMHDGVGGQLIALLTRARSGRLTPGDSERSLSNAVEDLRLVIDSLEVREGDLATALGKFRYRIERRLRDTGIRLVWEPGEPEAVTGFGPAEILQLLRLLDEATTNVIRHSRASEMVIAWGRKPEGIRIEVRDNGAGGVREGGYGLRNMRDRAASLGGVLAIDSRAGGTTVRVLIPVASGGTAT